VEGGRSGFRGPFALARAVSCSMGWRATPGPPRITPAHLGNWVARLLKRCGIDQGGSTHLFRHSCATHMHQGGADI